MRTLYLDCFSGISGDMMLGALIDLGIESERFIREMSKLNVFGFDIEIKKMNKYAITGTDVNVIVHNDANMQTGGHAGNGGRAIPHGSGGDGEHMHDSDGGGHSHIHEDGHTHSHDGGYSHSDVDGHTHSHEDSHAHSHDGGHTHDHDGEHTHDSGGGHSHSDVDGHTHSHDGGERSYKDILRIIEVSELDSLVKELSARVFAEIATAEGKVHDVKPEDVHFHEIGAIDSIVDIVGICICIWLLEISEIYASEIHEGKGFIETRHGRLPVPAPAVLAMLSGSGIPIVTENINTELATPTGIGVVKTLAKAFGAMPPMLVEQVGYGFGKRDIGRLNALRAVLGEPVEDARSPGDTITYGGMATTHTDGSAGVDHVISLDANIDDMTPEGLGYAMECLFTAGALDVFFTPIYMKKNRPATMLTVLARPKDRIILTDIIFKETTTLGVRESHMARTLMGRKTGILDFEPYGAIRYKIAERKGVKHFAPEYEDCRAYAARTGLSLAEVYDLARNKFSKTSNNA